MPDPVLPTIITGPALVVHNSYTYYVAGDVVEELVRETFDVPSAYGKLDERLRSIMYRIRFTPVGELESGAVAKLYPYLNATAGTTIMVGDCVVHQLVAAKTHTYHRGGVSQQPELIISATQPAFGEMEITCIGKSATQPTDVAYLKTVGTPAAFGTDFDPTKIITGPGSAALGARLTPYDAMGSVGGFRINFPVSIESVMDDGIGIADMRLSSIDPARCVFAPNNLTEAQLDTLMAVQGADVVKVGQSIAKAGEDLVITGDTISVTLNDVGALSGSAVSNATQQRHRDVTFVGRRTASTGVLQAVGSITIS